MPATPPPEFTATVAQLTQALEWGAIGSCLIVGLLAFSIGWQQRRTHGLLALMAMPQQVTFLLKESRRQSILTLSILTLLITALLSGAALFLGHLERLAPPRSDVVATTALPPKTEPEPIVSPPVLPSDILDVFEAKDQHFTEIDALKPRYENTLLIAYLLHRCHYIDQQELANVHHTLMQGLRAHNLTQPVKTDSDQFYRSISSGAEGTFHLLYGHIPCEEMTSLPKLSLEFKDFMSNATRLSPAKTPAP